MTFVNCNCRTAKSIFEKGCQLFIEKWSSKEKDFVEYFLKTWVQKDSNWFIGAAVRSPHTNNHSENVNGRVKKFHTYYERKSLDEFQIDMLNI